MKNLQMILPLILLISFTRRGSHEPSIKNIEGPPTMSSSVEKAPVVSWCDLVRNAAHYDKMIVRTRALLHADRENEFLYDPECDNGNGGTGWVDFDPSYIYTDEKLRKR